MAENEIKIPDLHDDEPMMEGEEEAPPGVRAASLVRWLMLAVALLGAGYTLAMASGLVGSEAHASEQYHCPMHPTVVSDGPGECPICGMDLVPVGDHGAADAHAGHDHEGDDAIRAVAEKLGAKPGQWVCPMPEDGVVSDEPGRCDECGMKLVQVPEEAPAKAAGGPAIYSCPMHPEIVKEGPGKCPKCGMYLERQEGAEPTAGSGKGEVVPAVAAAGEAPVEKKGVPGLVPVTIPAERLARIGVRTAKVERGSLEGQVRTVGVVAADERKRNVVQTRYAGWIEELLVEETGARVKKGQPLAKIYSPELYQAQVEYLNALQWGGDLVRPAQQRLELLGIAAADLQAIRKAGKPQRSLTLRAPANGHVLHKGAVAGSYVSPGTILFEVADLSKVWVLADVYEQDLARVKVGSSASFASSALPGDRFVGKVTFVYPTVDPATRTMKVRLEIANAEIDLRPGMFGDVRVDAAGRDGLVVPRDAVIESGDHVYTLVARGGGRFEPREVHIRGRSGDHLLVHGLEAGEEVVTSAGFFIDSESRLRAALSGMAGGSEAGAGHGGH
ncbi:efflux RND transporter periplasmic adaptor subunit [Vulgatibacter sp.]|uniref:efflux RND transporter periplasmic adaptor subunit n=1 Tax=Vulgatibacter sp. TaxID=1971226 RepID=UPI0035635052